MTATVLVGLSILEANRQDELRARAVAIGATVAFLQHGEPTLVAELTRLSDVGKSSIRLVPVSFGERAAARSWVRRVAGHWLRQAAARPTILMGDGDSALGDVTGREAPLTSIAWEDVPRHSHHLLVCRGPRCSARGADDVAASIDRALGEASLGDDDVLVTQTGCLFPCNQAPVVVLHPDDEWFGLVDQDAARRIVVDRIGRGVPVADHSLQRVAGTT